MRIFYFILILYNKNIFELCDKYIKWAFSKPDGYWALGLDLGGALILKKIG